MSNQLDKDQSYEAALYFSYSGLASVYTAKICLLIVLYDLWSKSDHSNLYSVTEFSKKFL